MAVLQVRKLLILISITEIFLAIEPPSAGKTLVGYYIKMKTSPITMLHYLTDLPSALEVPM